MKKQEDFITGNWNSALQAQAAFAMAPIIALTQSAYESGWGTSNLAKNHNNYFGVTGDKSHSKNKFWDGSLVPVKLSNGRILNFRKYKTPADSFADYARLISTKYPGAFAYAKAGDYQGFAIAIANSKYIAEENGDDRKAYAAGLISIGKTILGIAQKKNLLSTQVSG